MKVRKGSHSILGLSEQPRYLPVVGYVDVLRCRLLREAWQGDYFSALGDYEAGAGGDPDLPDGYLESPWPSEGLSSSLRLFRVLLMHTCRFENP